MELQTFLKTPLKWRNFIYGKIPFFVEYFETIGRIQSGSQLLSVRVE